MPKVKISSSIVGFAVGYLFSSLVLFPPLETYDPWVVLILITIAWLFSIFDK